MLASFMATGAFNTVYVQVAELYPTSVRNSALGVCSAWARVTSFASSLLPSLLGSGGSLACIAIVCATGAALSWAEVPETIGQGLPEDLPVGEMRCGALCCRAAPPPARQAARGQRQEPGVTASGRGQGHGSLEIEDVATV